MAIEDFASLRTAVLQKCHREKSTQFSNLVEGFIADAEERIYNGVGDDADPLFTEALRCSEISSSTTLAVTSGLATVPADSLEIRLLHRDSDTVGMDYLSPDHFHMRLAYADSGQPRWYTIEGTTIRTAPGGFTGNINIVYYAKPAGISSSNTTNAVLTAYPTLYLAATCFEAFTHTQDGEAAGGWLARYRSVVSGINRKAKGNRHGGGKTTSRPRMRIGS